MTNCITPNDKSVMGKSDSQSINNAVTEAIRSGMRRVVIPKINERTGKEQWDIDEAIILFSNIEIVLDSLRFICYPYKGFVKPAEDSRCPKGRKRSAYRGKSL